MKLLFVDCCISQRKEGSRTADLCRAFLRAASEADPGLQTERVDLTKMNLTPFTVPMLDERDELFRAGRFDHEIYALARQFRAADGIVVGAPFWDLSFPAQLRIYLEHISANGVTYYYDEEGPHGNCRAGQLVYLTSGGDFERAGSIGVEYWRQLCTMFGIRQYDSVFAGGLDAVPEKTKEFMDEACEKAAALGRKLAGKD
ncbi:MAG: NAD(P)H-dependent oxidoreductase [Lachnospiraceae bacterium]|jgi:FMN-dependent NADH-azoreductase|nr:NAD(P)H-dependent oxidoreductase [Lachnospiraceae bacterium]MCI1727659.1 NAD(P)H-dependent oxidoreductase [Lachnospiraceae bacterium]